MDDPPGISRDRYCAANVTLETCHAILVELEPLEDLRTSFMFWRDRAGNPKFQGDKPRIRDLRPGDQVVFQGLRRKVVKVEIFR